MNLRVRRVTGWSAILTTMRIDSNTACDVETVVEKLVGDKVGSLWWRRLENRLVASPHTFEFFRLHNHSLSRD